MTKNQQLSTTMTRRTLLAGMAGMTASAFVPEMSAAQEKGTVEAATVPCPVRFRKRVINAESEFEAACAADINGNKRLDIVSGDTWYEAPHWTPHKFREIGSWGKSPGESGYRRDFADIPVDVNGDGRIDIISCDYADGDIFWHENPGDSKELWERHDIAKPGSMETMVLAPILPDKVCLLPNTGGQIVWYELRTASRKPEWIEHVVGKQGAAHGVGWGDVNGDGKCDIVTPHGWWENVNARNDKWTWHGDWEGVPGDWGIGTPVWDVDGDGHNDIVFGSGHHYGLFWLQQQTSSSGPKWVQRPIETTWSQAHSLILADLRKNRRPVLLTGKRYKAHDHDPGANEPLCVYAYEYNRAKQTWEKWVIDAGTQTGTGLTLAAVDVRRTGRLDILCPGKSGLYLFENEGRR